ncbi:MAG: transposase [Cephaloticoccus sp.]|nr:transposase [Cephaloticoccus sp.]MCF7761424.1 transposase [Cephaloticoccus sp.]
MARRLRIEYPGALHHVINRGNYRRDLFASEGAAEAFVRTLFESAGKFSWRIHAYVLMSNHFHLAVETPEPTLGEGMHWLQSTMATRFNRLRKENGHLFQGRYKGLLIADSAALARVVDYIHLNPVRAKLVPPEQVADYRWSSLTMLLRGPRAEALTAAHWLHARGGWKDDKKGLQAYLTYLQQVAQDEAAWEREGLVGLAKGWAIGSHAWRQALAKEYARQSLSTGLPREELVELREARWTQCLAEHLTKTGKTLPDLITKPCKRGWKVDLANQVRESSGASIAWLATQLHLGGAATLRGYLHQAKQRKN